jgi:hypothetical protein
MSYNFKCKLLARSLQHEPPYHRRRQECVPRFHIGTMYMIIHNSFIAFFFRIKHLMGPGHRQVREMWPKQTLVWLMGWLQYMRLFQKKNSKAVATSRLPIARDVAGKFFGRVRIGDLWTLKCRECRGYCV